MRNVEVRPQRDSLDEQQFQFPRVALLTGGGDKHYAFGLAEALTEKNIVIDFIGSDQLASPTLDNNPRINFLNLRGDQNTNAPVTRKISRIMAYYLRLLRFAATARAPVFHVLWHNKLEYLDRTFLLLYYKLFGRRVVFTAHNVNAAERDSMDTWLNRFTLYVQYQLFDHIFVHTNKMRDEIEIQFRVNRSKITVIPYGINNVVPMSNLSSKDAKRQLGIDGADLTMLFFGQIAPYKGLDCLLGALSELAKQSSRYRLIIAGKPKWNDAYWKKMQRVISSAGIQGRVIQRIGFIPDDEIEVFFMAADVLILPYTHIFQSGVQFLAYSFGLPVIATDVGSLKETIVEGQTGFVCASRDSIDLAKTIQRYFTSELFCKLDQQRRFIKEYANRQFSWERVANLTRDVYSEMIARYQT